MYSIRGSVLSICWKNVIYCVVLLPIGILEGIRLNRYDGRFTLQPPNSNLEINQEEREVQDRIDYLNNVFQDGRVTLQPPNFNQRSIKKINQLEREVKARTDYLNNVIFEDDFETLDKNKWILEQYIPTTPDYEFVVYKKDNDVTFISNGTLCIKPKVIENMQELRKQRLDLTDGCTKIDAEQCSRRLYLIHNPIVSGRLVTKQEFSYGEFEVKARLPLGDWIYPEIYLEDENDRRILIAYSRGNAKLTGNDGTDLGGSLLFGGPVATHTEPNRSSSLSSYRGEEPLSKNVHVYKLRWTSGEIELYLDGRIYGAIRTTSGFTGENPSKFRLVIGVGVGGASDFPNDFTSGNYTKPWINFKANQVKSFYLNKDYWLPTWDEESRQLQIDYIKITSI